MVVLTKFMDGLNELEDLVEDPEPVHQQEDLPELIIDNSGQVRQPDGGVMQNKNLESGGLSAIFGDGFSFF